MRKAPYRFIVNSMAPSNLFQDHMASLTSWEIDIFDVQEPTRRMYAQKWCVMHVPNRCSLVYPNPALSPGA